MAELQVNSGQGVKEVFSRYPKESREQMLALRNLVLETAKELEDVDSIDETLKWGEPSYIAKKGSTIRMDWKQKTPGQYAMYFSCTSKLVPTFRAVFGDCFSYEGNRAIVFQLEEKLPVAELKQCVAAGLRYHKVKDQPLLGL